MKLLKAFIFLVIGVTAIVLLLFVIIWIFEYRPKDKEIIFHAKTTDMVDDTLKIVTWNTGYAGLSSDMNFFYDGGTQVREAQDKVDDNLKKISDFLANSNADIILLQEVDVFSRRSYFINQFELYKKILPSYHAYFTYNYNSLYVPVPLMQPMGTVRGGLAIFTKTEPRSVTRYQYPGGFDFPVRIFNLKRCLLSAEFNTKSGGVLIVNNTHNTAYDDGLMRSGEMIFLMDSLISQYSRGLISVTGGDWNQNPPSYIASEAEMNNEFFSPYSVDSMLLAQGWHFEYDDSSPSARYLYESYNMQTTTTTLIDMFLLSPHIETLNIETINLGFAHSDHNPVEITLKINISDEK